MKKIIKRILDLIMRLFKKQTKDVLISKQHKKEVLTNKQKRDLFLKSKGYTVVNKQPSNKEIKKQPSHFKSMVIKFISLKYNKDVNLRIKDYHNKQGIPYYDIIE